MSTYATDDGSSYAPLHSRTREPSPARSRQSPSVRRRYDCSTAPTHGKSSRSATTDSSVASVVVWSSMSTVTVVPAAAAASQIVRAWSVLIFGPSAPSAWPIADSFTETSARPPCVSPASDSRVSRVR